MLDCKENMRPKRRYQKIGFYYLLPISTAMSPPSNGSVSMSVPQRRSDCLPLHPPVRATKTSFRVKIDPIAAVMSISNRCLHVAIALILSPQISIAAVRSDIDRSVSLRESLSFLRLLSQLWRATGRLLQVRCPQRGATRIGESEEDAGNRYHLK